MRPQHRLDGRVVAFGRHDHAARAHHGLHDHGADRVGALGLDQGFQVGHQLGHELGVRQAAAFPEPVRRRGVADEGEWQVEARVIAAQARQARGRDRHAVVAAVAGDDLLLGGPVADVVVIPDELDLRVVGVRARIAEEHLRHGHRRHLDQLLGQQDGRVGRHGGEEVVVGQLERLLLQRLGDLGPAVADVHAPEPRHGVDVAVARVVLEPHALAPGHHHRALPLVVGQRREGMEHVLAVERREVGGVGADDLVHRWG